MAYPGQKLSSYRDLHQPGGYAGWARSPEGDKTLALAFAGALVAIVLYVILQAMSANKTVFRSPSLTMTTDRFVSEPFVLTGGGNVVVEVNSSVDNSFLDLELRIVDVDRKFAYLTNQDVEYYHGNEGGENWSEGSKFDEIYFSRIPAGTYVLEALPVGDAQNVRYELTVVRDRVRFGYFVAVLAWFGLWIGLILLGRSDDK